MILTGFFVQPNFYDSFAIATEYRVCCLDGLLVVVVWLSRRHSVVMGLLGDVCEVSVSHCDRIRRYGLRLETTYFVLFGSQLHPSHKVGRTFQNIAREAI